MDSGSDLDVGVSEHRLSSWPWPTGPWLSGGTPEVGAAGAPVTPGFVDFRTRYDGQIRWDDRATPVWSSSCGIALAPGRGTVIALSGEGTHS